MCLAIFKKAGLPIPFDNIKLAWSHNEDGAGLAIRGSNFVEIHKGFMGKNEFIEFLTKNEKHFINFDLVIHLRFTTSGNTNTAMTHPFPVSRKNADLKATYAKTDKAIIHNGVLFDPKLDCHGFSDTAIFAKWIAVTKPKMKKIKKRLGNDRLAIVTKEKVELLGEWHDLDGVMYSNLYSLQKPYSYSYGRWDESRWGMTSASAGMQEDYYDTLEELDYCQQCGSDNTEYIGVYTKTFECLDCHTVYNQEQYMELYDLNADGIALSEKRRSKKMDEYVPAYSSTMKKGNRYGT